MAHDARGISQQDTLGKSKNWTSTNLPQELAIIQRECLARNGFVDSKEVSLMMGRPTPEFYEWMMGFPLLWTFCEGYNGRGIGVLIRRKRSRSTARRKSKTETSE
jgi:hypothetical protein